jgi:hypothetical protein
VNGRINEYMKSKISLLLLPAQCLEAFSFCMCFPKTVPEGSGDKSHC